MKPDSEDIQVLKYKSDGTEVKKIYSEIIDALLGNNSILYMN